MQLIDLSSYPIKPALKILLQDKTTKKNIIFATDAYKELGDGFDELSEITIEKLEAIKLMPRVEKELEHQKNRTRAKAEVFTPSWICNKMNNHCDEEWFDMLYVFNKEKGHGWEIIEDKIQFPEGKTWKKYVDSRRIEITCGEAPYLVSRYDTTTGEILEINNRIGIIDRKLRIVNENAATEEEWHEWVKRAFQSSYGYEFQGDNLLIARINILNTYVDYYREKWKRSPSSSEVRKMATIITWNIWQMDGITATIPFGKPREDNKQMSLFDEEPESPICRIMDWRDKSSLKYTDLKKGAK